MGKTSSPQPKSAEQLSAKGVTPSPSWQAKLLLLPIHFYRYAISPLIPPRCRFYPTCSTYALEAIQVHGALKGGCLATKRLCRCHPFGGSGVDLVPPKE